MVIPEEQMKVKKNKEGRWILKLIIVLVIIVSFYGLIQREYKQVVEVKDIYINIGETISIQSGGWRILSNNLALQYSAPNDFAVSNGNQFLINIIKISMFGDEPHIKIIDKLFLSKEKEIVIESHKFAVESLYSEGLDGQEFGNITLKYLGKIPVKE